jgi:tellurite methyltransferase
LKNYKLNKNSQYWDKYYSDKKEILPNSDFSNFVISYLESGLSLIDIGCGDGRDSLFFSKNQIKTLGVDFSKATISKNKIYENKNLTFKRLNLMKIHNMSQKFNYAYCRFLLHAVSFEIQEQTFDWMYENISDKIFIETRVADENIDSEKYNHFRRDFTEDDVLKFLKKYNFNILYFKVSKNFSKYKKVYGVKDLKHDPLLLRIIIQK